MSYLSEKTAEGVYVLQLFSILRYSIIREGAIL